MAIRHKRTTTTGYTWQSGDTVEGQIGLNLTDGTLHFKKANGVYVNISEGGGGLTDIVQDTTPQLGGNLDVNGNSIVSASNGNISITPNGTGSVVLDGSAWPQDQGIADQVLITDGAGQTSWSVIKTIHSLVYNADSVTINKGQPVYLFGANGANPSVKLANNVGDTASATTYGLANETIAAGATGEIVTQGLIKNVDTSTYTSGDILYLGSTAGSLTTTKPYGGNHLVYIGVVTSVNAVSGRILVNVQNGYEIDELHGVDVNHTLALAANHYLRYTGSLWQNVTLDISHDTTPQLGGNLDVNGNSIVSTSNGNITIAPNGTGKVVISGDLQVDGTTTTINSTTLDVDDINITIAKGAANAAAANGGGITLEGPTTAATITYASADDSWNLNKKTSAPELQIDNININGNTIISTDTNGAIQLTPNGTGDVFLNADTVNFGDSGGSLLKSFGTSYEISTTTTNASKIVTTEGDGGISAINSIQLATDRVSLGKTGGNAIIHGFTNSGSLTLWGYADAVGSGSGGKIDIGSTANSNIEIAPNGTGDVYLTADTVRVGDSGANATITTNGAGDLILNTNSGTNSGSITIQDGTNGNMLLDANGTGVIVVNNAGTGISLVRRSASTGTQSNALGVQRNFTANTLANMNDHMAAVAFSMRDSASTQSFFTRVGGVYSTSNAHQIAFERSTDNFTNATRFATMAPNSLLLGHSTGSDAQNITTVTTQNLVLSTNQSTNSGTITIANGANQNISITPNGTGYVTLDGVNWPNTAGTNNFVLTTNGSNQASWTNPQSAVFTYTATNGGSFSLTSTSNYLQHIYGGSAATVTLPSTATMAFGQGFKFINNSGQTATINTSTSVLVTTIPTGGTMEVFCVNTGSNAATSWVVARSFETITGTGNAVLSAAPTITGSAVIGGTTFPSATGTTGQVLALSSAGTAAWTTSSGGAAEIAVAYATAYYSYASNEQRLNWSTEHRDPGSWLTLGTSTAAGQFTITSAGTYLIELFGSATHGDNASGTALYNTTGAANLQTQQMPSTTASTDSWIWPHYCYAHTITTSNTYEFRHSGAGSGLKTGSRMILKITKLA